ncbi:hypothetical protein phiOC_p235 [Ochrobactrum phage vB_OspM_OC]|nr:hypothetical protein phiOC_p235 [Ochrobactrum phage vB_OspM_OC]
MGSVMDQERPWEREARINGYKTMPMDKLQQEIEELATLPWEMVAYREATEVYNERKLLEYVV